MTDTQRMVRIAAIRALPDSADDTIRAELRRELLHSPDAYVREAVAQALGRMHDHAAVEPLIVATTDARRRVRDSAVAALASIGGDVRAIPAIAARLDDEFPTVQQTALDALQLLAESPDEAIARAATDAIARHGS